MKTVDDYQALLEESEGMTPRCARVYEDGEHILVEHPRIKRSYAILRARSEGWSGIEKPLRIEQSPCKAGTWASYSTCYRQAVRAGLHTPIDRGTEKTTVSVYISDELIKRMDDLVERKRQFRSRSAFADHALAFYFEEHSDAD